MRARDTEGNDIGRTSSIWDDILYFPEKPLGFQFSSRWIPEKQDHGQIYLNLSYEFTTSIRAGLDFRPLSDDISPLITWRVFPSNPDNWRPALIAGFANDDFGDINSNAIFASFTKSIGEVGGIYFSPYAGATYIRGLDEVRPVGGLHLRRGSISGIFQYSGVDEHVSLSYSRGNHTFTVLLFDLEKPGIAHTFKF